MMTKEEKKKTSIFRFPLILIIFFLILSLFVHCFVVSYKLLLFHPSFSLISLPSLPSVFSLSHLHLPLFLCFDIHNSGCYTTLAIAITTICSISSNWASKASPRGLALA